MVRSRLARVRGRRETAQGIVYLLLAIVIIFAMIIWGLPGLAKIATMVTKPNTQAPALTLTTTPPVFTDMPEATNSATVSLSGFAQPGVTVILFLNGAQSSQTLSTDSGTFNFANVSLNSGDNQVYAYATVTGSQQSQQSQTYTITYSTKKPTITLTTPKDGDTFIGQSQQIATFTGNVDEPGTTLYIGARLAILAPDNTFSLPYQLTQGSQQITLKATDPAGNETDQTITVTWNP